MMDRWNEYHIPQTIDEALALLAHYDGRARIVAGGTDYFVDDAHQAEGLIDVTRIAGLTDIREEDDGGERGEERYIVIGCGVTHTQIVQSPLIQRHGTALVEACGVIGGLQVRNVATLAGNIAHALPAADGTLPAITNAICDLRRDRRTRHASPCRSGRAVAEDEKCHCAIAASPALRIKGADE